MAAAISSGFAGKPCAQCPKFQRRRLLRSRQFPHEVLGAHAESVGATKAPRPFQRIYPRPIRLDLHAQADGSCCPLPREHRPPPGQMRIAYDWCLCATQSDKWAVDIPPQLLYTLLESSWLLLGDPASGTIACSASHVSLRFRLAVSPRKGHEAVLTSRRRGSCLEHSEIFSGLTGQILFPSGLCVHRQRAPFIKPWAPDPQPDLNSQGGGAESSCARYKKETRPTKV